MLEIFDFQCFFYRGGCHTKFTPEKTSAVLRTNIKIFPPVTAVELPHRAGEYFLFCSAKRQFFRTVTRKSTSTLTSPLDKSEQMFYNIHIVFELNIDTGDDTKMRKYNYYRNEMTFRCSAELDDLLTEASAMLNVAKNDILVWLVADWLDPTEQAVDWNFLPVELLTDNKDSATTVALKQYINKLAKQSGQNCTRSSIGRASKKQKLEELERLL